LEYRTLLTVTATLNGNVLDITLDASNDSAIVSQVSSNIDVFDGTMHTEFAASAVQSIDAQGNDLANQSVALDSAITLSSALMVSHVTTATVTGNYTVGSANLTADGTLTIAPGAIVSSRQIAAGGDPLTAHSTGDSGDLTFTAPAITVGDNAELLANADSGFTSGDVALT